MEKVYWYYRPASERNWAVINGLIKLYHEVLHTRLIYKLSPVFIFFILQRHFRIPSWLLEFYQNCRPIAIYAQRINPEVPEIPFPADGKGEAREIPVQDRAAFQTEANMAGEPCIKTKGEGKSFDDEWRTHGGPEALRARFIKQY